MKTRATNEWKVGAFIVGLVVLLIGTLFWLGANRLDTETVERVTYFDESVQGLELGAPVKIRGVTIGKVSDIRLAPDRRLVEVRSEIRVDAMRQMNVIGENQNADPTAGSISPEMRVIVAAQGITGVKFLEADFFPPGTRSVELSFDPPSTYIPSAPSTLKSLEDAVRGLGDELPLAVRAMTDLSVTLESRIGSIDTQALSDELTAAIVAIRTTLDGSATTGIGADASVLIADMRRATGKLEGMLDELSGTNGDGAIARVTEATESLARDVGGSTANIEQAIDAADLEGTSESIRDAVRHAGRLADESSRLVAGDLAGAVADLRKALRRFERLTALIERDPGIFLRGRGAPK